MLFQQNGNRIALDKGYDTDAVHRGLGLLRITGYIPGIDFLNRPEKYGFLHIPENDYFICPKGKALHFHLHDAAAKDME